MSQNSTYIRGKKAKEVVANNYRILTCDIQKNILISTYVCAYLCKTENVPKNKNW